MISQMLDRTKDLASAARVAGHSSTQTTMRYDRRGDDALKAAADAMGEGW
jgi:hypothetical protein